MVSDVTKRAVAIIYLRELTAATRRGDGSRRVAVRPPVFACLQRAIGAALIRLRETLLQRTEDRTPVAPSR